MLLLNFEIWITAEFKGTAIPEKWFLFSKNRVYPKKRRTFKTPQTVL